jgi:hypothetical protein
LKGIRMEKKLLIPLALSLLALFSLARAADVTVSASVQKYISVTFSYNAVSYGTLTAGSSNNPAPNQADGVYNVSVDTNYAYDVQAYGTDFSDGAGHSFSISNLKLDTNSTVSGLNVDSAKALSIGAQLIDSYDYTVTQNYHGYWLSIPAGQYASSYSATVTIIYENQL